MLGLPRGLQKPAHHAALRYPSLTALSSHTDVRACMGAPHLANDFSRSSFSLLNASSYPSTVVVLLTRPFDPPAPKCCRWCSAVKEAETLYVV